MKHGHTLLIGAALIVLSMKPFPGGNRGIGFDDLHFAPALRKVMVPGGGTGRLALIDPDSQKVEIIGGFSVQAGYSGGHGEGITSADAGAGLIYVTDRSARLAEIVDPGTRKVIGHARPASEPDYVRFVPQTNELWVTEPRAERIEIFALSNRRIPVLIRSGSIAVRGGPESLIIGHRQAFTHLWRGITLVIDLRRRQIIHRWANGCRGSRGIALDERRGFLFAGCDEGQLSVLELNSGKALGETSAGSGVDIIAYNQDLAHVYLPGASSGTLAIVGISSAGTPTVLQTINTVKGAHCASADDRGRVYVCDPDDGRILVFKDSLPRGK